MRRTPALLGHRTPSSGLQQSRLKNFLRPRRGIATVIRFTN